MTIDWTGDSLLRIVMDNQPSDDGDNGLHACLNGGHQLRYHEQLKPDEGEALVG